MRGICRNEIESYVERTISRILTKQSKKIRSGVGNVMDRVTSIFRMINDTEEREEDFIQEAYTYATFLLSIHIQEKIGKEIKKGNTYRPIPKKKGRERFNIQEKVEGKDVEKGIQEAKRKADKQDGIMAKLRTNLFEAKMLIGNKIYREV
jgi:hypothetical protein